MTTKFTYLDLVNATDVVPYPDQKSYKTQVLDNTYVFLSHDGIPIGRIVKSVAQACLQEPDVFETNNTLEQHGPRSIQLHKSLTSFAARNKALASVTAKWHVAKQFHILEGWRNELYTVFNPSQVPYLLVERAAAALFGVITYGVHIVGYVPSTSNHGILFWIPKRSYSKATFPGMLDNTVAGGLGYPYGVFETAVKECEEEAGFSESYVIGRLRPAGVISYTYQHAYESLQLTTPEENIKNDEADETGGLFQPEVEYIYDLEMDESAIPKPNDGEVESFNLMTVEEVKTEMFAGNFKPNTALVQMDFFIRHGIITPEDEPNYMELVARTHRRMEYPVR